MKIEIKHDFKPDWGMLGWTADLYIDDVRISSGVGMDRDQAIGELARKVEGRVLRMAREQPYDHLLPAHQEAVAEWTAREIERESRRARR